MAIPILDPNNPNLGPSAMGTALQGSTGNNLQDGGLPPLPPVATSASAASPVPLKPLTPPPVIPGVNGTTASAVSSTPAPQQSQQPSGQPPATLPGVNGQSNPGGLAQAMLAIQNSVQNNNALVNQRNLILKQLYDVPLSDADKSQLDPALASVLQSGDRNAIDFNLRLLNDQIAGRTNTLDQSVQYLGTAYNTQQQQIQTNYNDAITNVLNYARANGQSPSAIMQALYPQYAATLGPKLDQILAPSGEYIGANNQLLDSGSVTIPSGTLASANNNPGNLRFVGQAGATQGQDGFASFTSPEAGYQALVNDVAMKMNGQSSNPVPDGPDQGQPLTSQSTLEDMIRIYAPTADGNNPVAYATTIAKALGVSPQTPLSQLNANQVAQQIANHESGTSLTTSAPPLLIPSQRSAAQAANTAINNSNEGKAFQNASQAYGAIQTIDPNTTDPAAQQQALMNLAQLEFPGTNSARGLLSINPASAQDSGFASALLSAQRILQQTGQLQPGVIAQLQAQAEKLYNNTKTNYDKVFQANAQSLSAIIGKSPTIAAKYLTNLDSNQSTQPGSSGSSGTTGNTFTSASGKTYTLPY